MEAIGWTKIENENGFPCYFNKRTSVKQWDHPLFREIGQRLDDCNYVKYSIYRVALKFRVLQNLLCMNQIPLQIVAGVFEKHRLGTNESSLCLDSCELEAVLYDIFFICNKKYHFGLDVDLTTELMLNLLYNVFDPNRKGKIQVSSAKFLLALLSDYEIKDLYKYIFLQCCDHNNCITRQRLHDILSKITEVMTYFHEDASYGPRLLNISVENCFLNSPGFLGINETMFMSWIYLQPKILSWISILHRIKIAEPVIHITKCRTCRSNPIIGLRYKCRKCVRYTQCQRCFFTGKISNSHKLSHSMREYCTSENNTTLKIKIFKKLCSILRFGNYRDDSVIVDTKYFQNDKNCVVLSNSKEQCDIKPMSSPKTQLRLVIKRLEMQTKDLHQFLLSENFREKDILRYLEEHKEHISAQVEKLKVLKDCIASNHCSPQVSLRKSTKKRIFESTPVGPNNYRSNIQKNKSLEIFSPIISTDEYYDEDDEKNEGSKETQEISERGGIFPEDNGTVSYNIDDISSWIGGNPSNSTLASNTNKNDLKPRATSKDFHNELDEVLAQLQQILANNIGLEDSLNHIDNTHLKYAMSEVEGMLTSFIDTVEHSRASSVRSKKILSIADTNATGVL